MCQKGRSQNPFNMKRRSAPVGHPSPMPAARSPPASLLRGPRGQGMGEGNNFCNCSGRALWMLWLSADFLGTKSFKNCQDSLVSSSYGFCFASSSLTHQLCGHQLSAPVLCGHALAKHISRGVLSRSCWMFGRSWFHLSGG